MLWTSRLQKMWLEGMSWICERYSIVPLYFFQYFVSSTIGDVQQMLLHGITENGRHCIPCVRGCWEKKCWVHRRLRTNSSSFLSRFLGWWWRWDVIPFQYIRLLLCFYFRLILLYCIVFKSFVNFVFVLMYSDCLGPQLIVQIPQCVGEIPHPIVVFWLEDHIPLWYFV